MHRRTPKAKSLEPLLLARRHGSGSHLLAQLLARRVSPQVPVQAVRALGEEGLHHPQCRRHGAQQLLCDVGQLRVDVPAQTGLQGSLDLGCEEETLRQLGIRPAPGPSS